MYVCLRNGLTDRQIREAAGNGAASSRDVFTGLGVRPVCGKCCSCVDGMITERDGSRAVPGAAA